MKQSKPSTGSVGNQTENTQSSAGYTLGGAPVSFKPLPEQDLQPGTIIDDFIILKKIGRGGCGVVYKAQRKSFAREAAFKLIRPDLVVEDVIKRFEKEKEALGLLKHPNIVDIIFYGKTDPQWGGRPYIAMEYVDGPMITRYCENNKLSISDRLQLFKQVCEAIDEAHSHGIIHRDIKPSNILVAEELRGPVVKVIDFGIAKAISNGLPSEYATRSGQSIGTPAYMSPEQTGQDPDLINEASDIYGLGGLLYELLVGCGPLNLDGLDRSERDRCIREVVPQSPSAKFNEFTDGEKKSIALRRDVGIFEFKAQLQGGLDQIVMKCLEKKRHRRFPSVSRLNDEILIFLESPFFAKKNAYSDKPPPSFTEDTDAWRSLPKGDNYHEPINEEQKHNPSYSKQSQPDAEPDATPFARSAKASSAGTLSRLLKCAVRFKSAAVYAGIAGLLLGLPLFCDYRYEANQEMQSAQSEATRITLALHFMMTIKKVSSDEDIKNAQAIVSDFQKTLDKVDISYCPANFKRDWSHFLRSFSNLSDSLRSCPHIAMFENKEYDDWHKSFDAYLSHVGEEQAKLLQFK